MMHMSSWLQNEDANEDKGEKFFGLWANLIRMKTNNVYNTSVHHKSLIDPLANVYFRTEFHCNTVVEIFWCPVYFKLQMCPNKISFSSSFPRGLRVCVSGVWRSQSQPGAEEDGWHPAEHRHDRSAHINLWERERESSSQTAERQRGVAKKRRRSLFHLVQRRHTETSRCSDLQKPDCLHMISCSQHATAFKDTTWHYIHI